MKAIIQTLALTVIISLSVLDLHARTWTRADSKSTTVGDLIAYNAATGEVTLERAGKRITFNQKILSESDIAFLKNGKGSLVSISKPDYTFTPAPLANGKPWLIKNFGPVGIGIMLEKVLVMKIQTVFAGLPEQLVSRDTGIYVIPDGATAKRSALGISLGFSEEGKQFMKTIPKTTLKSYISGKDSYKFVFSGKFQNDKKYVGTWLWAVWPAPKHPGEIDTRIKEWLKKSNGNVDLKNSKDTVELRADGTVLSQNYYGRKFRPSGYFWTENTIFAVNAGEAYQMEIRTYDGHEFLIIESGGYAPVIPKEGEIESTAVPSDLHCGYHIYARKLVAICQTKAKRSNHDTRLV